MPRCVTCRATARALPVVVVLAVGIGVFRCETSGSTNTAGDRGEQPESDSVPATVDLSGQVRDVHDPAAIRAHGRYYLYSTGGGIQWRSSPDGADWTYEGDVLDGVPSWAESITEGDLWAPDIIRFDGTYHLYYSASTFGSGRSAIGVATNSVLSPDSAAYEWTDQGKVIESYNRDPYNAIDPNVIEDKEGRLWMAFGSWNDTGIRMRRLDPDTGKPSEQDKTFYSLATRSHADDNAIEAPYIIRHNDSYYLFVSFDHCCRGVGSDYNIRVGRAESVTGPYVDKNGTPMTKGGGTIVLQGWSGWKGPGHNAVIKNEEETFLVYHAYSVGHEGAPFLRISPLEWSGGWPYVPMGTAD